MDDLSCGYNQQQQNIDGVVFFRPFIHIIPASYPTQSSPQRGASERSTDENKSHMMLATRAGALANHEAITTVVFNTSIRRTWGKYRSFSRWQWRCCLLRWSSRCRTPTPRSWVRHCHCCLFSTLHFRFREYHVQTYRLIGVWCCGNISEIPLFKRKFIINAVGLKINTYVFKLMFVTWPTQKSDNMFCQC